MQQYIHSVTTRGGAAVSGASVLVKTYPGGVVATIYSDDGVTEATNPLTTDANGEFSFYAADGRYSLTISKTGVIEQRTIEDILLHDPDDADAFASAADVSFVQSGSGAIAETVSGYLGRLWYPVTSSMSDAERADVAAKTRAVNVRTAFQSALDNHDVVFVPDGDYLINSAAGLKLNDNQVLILSPGATIVRGANASGATIENEDTTNGNSNITIIGGVVTLGSGGSGGYNLKMMKVTGFRWHDTKITGIDGTWNAYLQINDAIISRLWIDSGDGLSEDGLHILGGEDISISDCYIKCGDDAIALVVSAESVYDIKNVTINNVVCHSAAANLLKIEAASGGTANTISAVKASNIVGSNGGSGRGMVVSDVLSNSQIFDIDISNVYIDASGSTNAECVDIDDVSRVKLSNITIDTPAQRGLLVQGSADDIRAERVTVLTPAGGSVPAVRAAVASNVHFSGFKVTGSKSHGIDFTTVTGGSIKDSIITGGASGAGIFLSASTGIEVCGNNSSSNTNYGLTEQGASDNNNIHDNQFLSNTLAPISGLVGASTRFVRNRGLEPNSVITTAVGNVGGGEDDLMSFALPANSLFVAGRGVKIKAWGTTANNSNPKTVKLYFTNAQVILTTALTVSQAGKWYIEGHVISTGTNAQDYMTTLNEYGATAQTDMENGSLTVSQGSAITIKCTGTVTDGGGGINNDDIVQEGLIVEYITP